MKQDFGPFRDCRLRQVAELGDLPEVNLGKIGYAIHGYYAYNYSVVLLPIEVMNAGYDCGDGLQISTENCMN